MDTTPTACYTAIGILNLLTVTAQGGKDTLIQKMTYIATFYSHFDAVRFKKYCTANRWPAIAIPAPRDLSSSCGTCVRFEGVCLSDPAEKIEQNIAANILRDVEQIVSVTEEGYQSVYHDPL